MLDLAELTEIEKAMQRDTNAMISGLRANLEKQISQLRSRIEALEKRLEVGSSAGNLYPANWSPDVAEYIKSKEEVEK